MSPARFELPRDGIGFVFDSQTLNDAARLPPRTALYAVYGQAEPRRVRTTEGHHGDGNHLGSHDTKQ